MLYELPANNLYGNKPVLLDFPASWEVQICPFAGATAPALTESQISEKINQPVGTGTIAEEARGCKDAVIIFDDISRPTPIEPIAKAVIRELLEAGVPRESIRFVCATGAHRAMSREDCVRKLGEELVQEYRIYSHNPFFNNVYVGTTTNGVPIELNAECVQAAYKVGIGAVMPHPATGMGGGAKLVLPGIVSLNSILRFHAQPGSRWDMGSAARKDILEAAEFLGLNMKIDVLLNGQGEIADLYAGHFEENITSHRVDIMAFYATEYAGKADLVLANNYFKPSEPVMIDSFLLASVKDGGDFICSAHSPQGCIPHYAFGAWGDTGIGGALYKGPAQIPGHIKRYFAFSEYQFNGVAASYYPAGEGLIWVRTWAEILHELGTAPKKVAVYPYATVGYYKTLDKNEAV